MSWADPVIATALATLAERTATTVRIPADTPWTWSARDVWLTRVTPPRALSAQSSSPPCRSTQSTPSASSPAR